MGPNKDSSNDEIPTDDSECFPYFPSIFKKPATDNTKKCGLLCTLFKNFDTQLKTIEEEVREIRDKEREKENEISQGDDQESTAPVNEYTEEVLPDGTIVRTNKTYSTNEDGTSFFAFQCTSFNSFGHSADEGKDDETDEQSETGEDGDNVVEETISGNIPSTQEYEDIEEEREELEENVGVDEGLFNA